MASTRHSSADEPHDDKMEDAKKLSRMFRSSKSRHGKRNKDSKKCAIPVLVRKSNKKKNKNTQDACGERIPGEYAIDLSKPIINKISRSHVDWLFIPSPSSSPFSQAVTTKASGATISDSPLTQQESPFKASPLPNTDDSRAFSSNNKSHSNSSLLDAGDSQKEVLTRQTFTHKKASHPSQHMQAMKLLEDALIDFSISSTAYQSRPIGNSCQNTDSYLSDLSGLSFNVSLMSHENSPKEAIAMRVFETAVETTHKAERVSSGNLKTYLPSFVSTPTDTKPTAALDEVVKPEQSPLSVTTKVLYSAQKPKTGLAASRWAD